MRNGVADFSLANPIYAGATVSFYTVSAGVKTSTLATLYAGLTGSTTLTNPQAMDSDGKCRQPIYVDEPVIASVSGLTIADHDTGIIQAVLSAGSVASVYGDFSASSGASLIGYIASGTGAVATTAQTKFRESVSLADFGADGAGTETTEIQAALTAHNVVCVPGLTTYTSGALTSTGKTIKWPAGMYTVNSNLADPLVLSNLTGAPALTFTLESRHAHARYFGDVTANDIYDAIYPDVSNFDVSCNVLHLAASSSVITNSAVAGYVKSDAAAAAGGNAVALFGCGMASSNDAAVWGLNTLLQDDATRAVGTGTGRVLIGAEYDFNVMNTDTDVTGCSVGGNSLSAPAASNGYQVSPLGTGVPWGAGFVTQDAAATVGISIGMLATSGADVDSQPLYFSWTDSGSVKRTAIVDVVNGFLRFQSTGTLAGYSFQGANILIDTGKSLVVNGNGVVSDRQTGYAAMTGTANKAATYDTATVSLAQLAGRVMQLQADLTTHGLIGA